MRVLGLVSCLMVGCGSAGSASTEGNLSSIEQTYLDERLAFLGQAERVEAVDENQPEGVQALSFIQQAVDSDPKAKAYAAQWVSEAGTEEPSHVVRVTMKDGRTAKVASREWFKKGSGEGFVQSSVAVVVPPEGKPFVYAERHHRPKGIFGPDEVDLYLIEGKGFERAGGYSFDPSATELESQFAELRLLNTGSEVKPASSRACKWCANGLLTAKVLGVAAAYGAGSGAGMTVCALVGVPTAGTGSAACTLILMALSSAMTLPFEFEGRAGICNYMTVKLLGMNPVCAGYDTVKPETPSSPKKN